jgi:hypothetical protein
MALSRVDDYIKSAQVFLAKSDGRDKLLATLQYAAMVAAAGEAGRALKVQKNLGAARKPFRILKARSVRRACMPARGGSCGVCAAAACVRARRAVTRRRGQPASGLAAGAPFLGCHAESPPAACALRSRRSRCCRC